MIVGGIDECGTGSCAGPIISVMAVFADEDKPKLPWGVKDSKKTTKNQRNLLYSQLMRLAKDVGIGWAWPWEIDAGFNDALQLSYKRATEGINPAYKPDMIIVDGVNHIKSWEGKQLVEPKADNNHWQVSAASIIGKVYRDTIMEELGKKFPVYGFENHFGYGTPEHQEAAKKHGLLLNSHDHDQYVHRDIYWKKYR